MNFTVRFFSLLFSCILVFTIQAQIVHDLGRLTKLNGGYNPRLVFFSEGFVYHAELNQRKASGSGNPILPSTIGERILYRTSLNDFTTKIYDTLPSEISYTNYSAEPVAMASHVKVGSLDYILMSGGRMYSYDTKSRKISQKQTFNGTYSNGLGSMIYDGGNLIYYWGGNAKISSTWRVGNELYIYNINTNLWSYLGNTPVSSDGMSGFYDYPYLYFSAGLSNHLYGGMYRYNLLDSSWTSITGPVSKIPWYYQEGGDLVFKVAGDIVQLNCYDSDQGPYWKLSTLNSSNLSWSKIKSPTFKTASLGTGNYSRKIYKNQTNTNAYNYRGYTYFVSGLEEDYSRPNLYPGNPVLGRISTSKFCQIKVDSTSCVSNKSDSITIFYTIELHANLSNAKIKIINTDKDTLITVDSLTSITMTGGQSLNRIITLPFSDGIELSIEGSIRSANKFPIKNKISWITTPSLTANRSPVFCKGQQIGLVMNSNLKSSNSKWQKQSSNDWVDLNEQPSASLTVLDTGNYRYLYKNINGCSSPSNPLAVRIDNTSSSITIFGDTIHCELDSMKMSVPFDTLNTYQWLVNNTNISGANNSFFSPQTTGIYSVKITNNSNCTTKSRGANVTVFPYVKNTTIIGQSTKIIPLKTYTYTVSEDPSVSFSWYAVNGAIVSGASTNRVDIIWNTVENGKLFLTKSNGLCESNDSLYIKTTLNIAGHKNKVSLYPNPTSDIIHIGQTGLFQYEIYNQLGQILKSGSSIGIIDVRKLPVGNYHLVIINGQERSNLIFIKL